jgi:signal peptidase I
MEKRSFLKNVRYDKALKLINKRFIHNYYELASEINFLEENEFDYHRNHDDIIDWIKQNYQDDELIKKLKEAKSKKDYIFIIKRRISSLESELKKQKLTKEQALDTLPKPNPWLPIIIILATMILMQHLYFSDTKLEESNELLKAKNEIFTLDSKLQEYEKQMGQLEAENRDLKNRANNIFILYPKNENTTSPSNRINENQIIMEDDRITILLNNALLAKFTETGSMLPVLDGNTNALEIIPRNYTELQPGDIISYKLDNKIIIHRIIEIGLDDDGWYAYTKGDNNAEKDPEIVRFNQVQRVVVGILY